MNSKIIVVVIILLAVFSLESATPLGYVAWVLYFIPFIIASRLLDRFYILLLSAVIIFLIIIGFFISPAGPSTTALINRVFGIFAVIMMSYLTIRLMRAEEEIIHLAHHDPLTGLPNRRLLMDIAALELARARRNDKRTGILYLDLDGFKEVNDTYGHETGDKLLVRVAERLRDNVRKSDSVARLGGDEFTVILSEINSADEAAEIARKIIAAFHQPLSAGDHELRVTMSVGISIYPDDSRDIAVLMKYADNALYQAKKEGKNTLRLYGHPAMPA